MLWMVLLGIVTGMRSMTGLAVLCWFAWLGLVPETGWAAWSATPAAAIVFGLCAVGEYAGDLSPRAPRRTAIFPLAVRLLIGGLVGALVARALTEPVAGGVIFGVIGVLMGAYGGVHLRMWLARKVGLDWPVGVTESVVALGLAVAAAMLVYQDIAWDAALQRVLQ